jgi:hypothetical protein
VDKLDIYASTDDARTVRLDHALSVAQASAMRGGDQILLSTKTGSYTCLMTLKGDAVAGNTLQSTAATLGFGGPTASADTNACRVPMAGRVLSIDASEAVTFAGVHGLGVGDLVMLTGLAGGGAGLVEGEVYKVKTVSSTTVVVLEGGADATILMASIGTHYYATAAVSAAYTGANATVVARKVSSVSNSGVMTFASASHGSTVGQSYYIHSMTGGVGGSAQIRGIGGARTDVPRPIAVQDLGASATTTATGATTWSAASPTAIAISSAVTSAHAVVGTAAHFIATPTGATHPRVYSKYGHSFGTGDKVVFSELRAHAAPLSGTSVTITADCTAADPALCTTSGSVNNGLSTGDRLKCTSDGTGGGTAPLKVESTVTYIVTVVDEDTFSLEYAYCSPGGSCSAGTEPGNAVEVGTGTQTGVVFTVPGGGLQAGKTYTVGGTWKDTNGDNYINTAAVAADEFAAGTMTAATGAIAVGSDPGWVAGDVLMASTVASAASGIAVDDLYVVTSNSGSVVMLETLDGNAVVKWKGDATIKFLKVPYFELTGDDGGTITMTEPYMAAGSGAFLHPVGHDKPLDKLYVFTAHMLQYEGIVTNGDEYGGVGGLKDAQSVTASTGAIVVESLGSQAKDLSQGIFPGDCWVRVYDSTLAGGYYCDCEANAQLMTDSAALLSALACLPWLVWLLQWRRSRRGYVTTRGCRRVWTFIVVFYYTCKLDLAFATSRTDNISITTGTDTATNTGLPLMLAMASIAAVLGAFYIEMWQGSGKRLRREAALERQQYWGGYNANNQQAAFIRLRKPLCSRISNVAAHSCTCNVCGKVSSDDWFYATRGDKFQTWYLPSTRWWTWLVGTVMCENCFGPDPNATLRGVYVEMATSASLDTRHVYSILRYEHSSGRFLVQNVTTNNAAVEQKEEREEDMIESKNDPVGVIGSEWVDLSSMPFTVVHGDDPYSDLIDGHDAFDDVVCAKCGSSDDSHLFLYCGGCGNPYHIRCADVPLIDLIHPADDDWECPICVPSGPTPSPHQRETAPLRKAVRRTRSYTTATTASRALLLPEVRRNGDGDDGSGGDDSDGDDDADGHSHDGGGGSGVVGVGDVVQTRCPKCHKAAGVCSRRGKPGHLPDDGDSSDSNSDDSESDGQCACSWGFTPTGCRKLDGLCPSVEKAKRWTAPGKVTSPPTSGTNLWQDGSLVGSVYDMCDLAEVLTMPGAEWILMKLEVMRFRLMSPVKGAAVQHRDIVAALICLSSFILQNLEDPQPADIDCLYDMVRFVLPSPEQFNEHKRVMIEKNTQKRGSTIIAACDVTRGTMATLTLLLK